MRKYLIIVIIAFFSFTSNAAYILIPMDDKQTNHLKAYGIAYWVLQNGEEVSWLLNYRGGSYLFYYNQAFEQECIIRNVSYEIIADVQASSIRQEIARPEVNMEDVKLHKAPKIAVYLAEKQTTMG